MAEPHPSITIHRRGFKAPFKGDAAADERARQVLQSHLNRYLGPVGDHWKAVKEERVRLDFFVVEATYERNFLTLVTAGMSDAPMQVTRDFEFSPYLELMVALPKNWRLDEPSLSEPKWNWPLEGLATLGTLPHEYGTYLWEGHIWPNGDPPEPLSPAADFVAWLIMPPVMAPAEALTVNSAEKEINLIAAVPIYQEEMELAMHQGLNALYKRFDRKKITEIIIPGRKNVGKRGFQLFK